MMSNAKAKSFHGARDYAKPDALSRRSEYRPEEESSRNNPPVTKTSCRRPSPRGAGRAIRANGRASRHRARREGHRTIRCYARTTKKGPRLPEALAATTSAMSDTSESPSSRHWERKGSTDNLPVTKTSGTPPFPNQEPKRQPSDPRQRESGRPSRTRQVPCPKRGRQRRSG